MLARRVLRYARWRTGIAWRRIRLRALVPWLRLRGLVRGPARVVPTHAGVVIVMGESALKLALDGGRSARAEYAKYAKAVERWPQLIPMLAEYRLQEDGRMTYIAMPSYKMLDAREAQAYAVDLYRCMRQLTAARPGPKDASHRVQWVAGVECIESLYGTQAAQAVRSTVERYLASGRPHVGFAHGDFHSRNVMLDAAGGPRLVDLDCLRLDGIQELDALYFVLELEWSRSGTIWHATLARFLNGEMDARHREALAQFGVECDFALCVTYLADRLGQETSNFGFVYTRAMLDPAMAGIMARIPDGQPTKADSQ